MANLVRKISIINVFLVILAFLLPLKAFSAEEAVKQNKFGIHLANHTDIGLAAKLVNSGGGDWGWVTIVIREDELNRQQWQDFFDQARRLHIIPIIRLATTIDGNSWKAPTPEGLKKSVEFLDSLNWPVKKRYIVAYNEPNHANEWGGIVDPKGYADIFIALSEELKKRNEDYFLLLAGSDQAAPTDKLHLSATEFYRQMYLYKPEVFEIADGLASHSYPNHGFIGKPTDVGKATITGYRWELSYFKSLGAKKTLPVFITETGWPHREGITSDKSLYAEEALNKLFDQSYRLWNADKNVYSFTPFILRYSQEPFDHFSWVNASEELCPAYSYTQNIPKDSSRPEQVTKWELTDTKIPFLAMPGREYQGEAIIKNTGQSIWGEYERLCWQPVDNRLIELTTLCIDDKALVAPGEIVRIKFTFKINPKPQDSSKIRIEWEGLPSVTLKILSDDLIMVYRQETNIFQKISEYWYDILPRRWRGFPRLNEDDIPKLNSSPP